MSVPALDNTTADQFCVVEQLIEKGGQMQS